jgi:hypothetical protein
MQNNRKLLLVHNQMPIQKISSSIDIMITPQLYTVKKVLLPIKYLYQAKKIAKSLFDGVLDPSKTYEYFVYKEKESWVYIAYNIESIKKLLLSKEIPLIHINKLFFAQQSFSFFSSYIKLGTEALTIHNDIVVVLPINFVENEIPSIEFEQHFIPKIGITLKGLSKSLFSKSHAMILSATFILFAIIFLMEGIFYNKRLVMVNSELKKLFIQSPMLESEYSRNNIMLKYKTINTLEIKKREKLKSLSKLIFKGVSLIELSLNNKSIKVTFLCKTESIAKDLVRLVQRKDFRHIKTIEKTMVYVEAIL